VDGGGTIIVNSGLDFSDGGGNPALGIPRECRVWLGACGLTYAAVPGRNPFSVVGDCMESLYFSPVNVPYHHWVVGAVVAVIARMRPAADDFEG
jgi:hypothetical protein